MLAVRIDVHGGPEVLRAVQMAPPDPRPSQVLVRHEAIGVNFVDTQHRAGAPYPVHLPLIPGIEAAGQVVGVGAAVEELREGDRVGLCCVPRDRGCAVRLLACELALLPSRDLPSPASASHPM
jgi:NADPH:quinone reductase-like Zn-dependent oxidoreductase